MIGTLVQYLTAVSLDQVNHDRNRWFSTLLKVFHHHFPDGGMLQ
jgi:hypothetical protein